MKMYKSLKDEPILIIAVNSGNSRREVMQYMKRVNVNLPTIVDRDRSFEQKFEFEKITLDNVLQMRVVRPNKKMTYVPLKGKKEALQKKKGSPSWTIAPSEVPDRLKPLWRAVEFGNFQRAGRIFQKLDNVSGAERKTVDKLRGVVHRTAGEQLERAKSLRESDKPWEAFKLYRDVALSYRTFPEFEPPRSALQLLKKEKPVKKQLKALRIFENIMNESKRKPGGFDNKEIRTALDQLIRNFPDSDAAQQAKHLLN